MSIAVRVWVSFNTSITKLVLIFIYDESVLNMSLLRTTEPPPPPLSIHMFNYTNTFIFKYNTIMGKETFTALGLILHYQIQVHHLYINHWIERNFLYCYFVIVKDLYKKVPYFIVIYSKYDIHKYSKKCVLGIPNYP